MEMRKSGEREGCDVYVGDTSRISVNYMVLAGQRLTHDDTGPNTVEADITHLSEGMFVGKLGDWLWDNCFNCWAFMEIARQNGLKQWWSDFIVRFDAESDAIKFQEFYNKGWSYGTTSLGAAKRMSDPNRKNPLDKTS